MDARLTNRLQRLSWREWILGTVAASLVIAFVAVLLSADYSSRFSIGFDLIGATLFITTGGIAVASLSLPWRKRAIALFLLVMAYVGSYTALSARGDYFWSQSGKLRYNNGTGLAVTDRIVWHPKWLYWEPFVNVYGTSTSRGTSVGYFYMPLLYFDREWIHPTKPFFSDN